VSSRPISAELALKIAPVVLANITALHPYHDSHLFRDGDGALDPFAVHPAFGNSYDWHSSVHSHWTALRLLARFDADGSPPGVIDSLRAAATRSLTAANIEMEAAYLESRHSYERPYGWAWAMKLAAAARESDVAADAWEALQRFALLLADRAVAWLHAMPGPVRHGVHSNTAFAMGLMLDASRALGFAELARVIDARARAWFGGDRDYPAEWERSAHDFLSPGLSVADLMRRVSAKEDLMVWWRAFVPAREQLSSLVSVVDVPDVSDGQIVHLHGLNLSRAGVLARLASIGGEFEPLLADARTLYAASAAASYGGEYLSTHWLPTFAWDAATSIDAAARSGTTSINT